MKNSLDHARELLHKAEESLEIATRVYDLTRSQIEQASQNN